MSDPDAVDRGADQASSGDEGRGRGLRRRGRRRGRGPEVVLNGGEADGESELVLDEESGTTNGSGDEGAFPFAEVLDEIDEDDFEKEPSAREDKGRNKRRRNKGGRDVEELGASSGIDALEPAAEKRDGNRLAPGLALKDLLPFLRPPKTVLVFGASTGAGHARAAAAIFEAMKGLDRNLVVRSQDLIELAEPVPGPARTRELLDEASRSPELYGEPFETSEDRRDPGAAPATDPFEKVFGEALDHVVVDKRPDWIVTTHWLPFRHLEALKKNNRLNAQVIAVVTEPDLHARWRSAIVGHWIVPEDSMRARLLDEGVPADQVTVAGVPVAPAFGQSFDRGQVQKSLGLDRNLTTVLLRPGGIGSTERILAVIQRLLAKAGPMNLLVLAGKNDRLKQDIEALPAPAQGKVLAFGFVDNIHELMGLSDLLITRAAPHTVAEAAASGLPMVLLRPTPGLEDRMADRLLRRGVAVKASSLEDLEAILREFVTNKRSLRELNDAAEQKRRPDAVQVVVQRIARIVK